MAAGVAWGQGQLVIRPSYPVEAGAPIPMFEGSDLRLPGRGCPGPDPSAARVEIRAVEYALGGTGIVPPTADGEGDAKNPLIVATRIGAGVVGAQPGRFAVCLPRRALTNVVAKGGLPGNYQGFFARVYDGPTVEESHYYIDSELVGYDPDAAYTNLTFRGAMKALNGDDEQDSDGDGLTDREELAIGTNYASADSDGDGLNDWFEHHYGFDPMTANPLLITAISQDSDNPSVTAILPEDSEWHVEWEANTHPELRYSLEYVYDPADWPENGGSGEHVLKIRVGQVAGSGEEATMRTWAQDITDVMNDPAFSRGYFRLCVEGGEEE